MKRSLIFCMIFVFLFVQTDSFGSFKSEKTFHLIVGPSCEKTNRLIHYLELKKLKKSVVVQAFNYNRCCVTTPCGEWKPAQSVKSAQQIKDFLKKHDTINVVAIDCVEKFDEAIIPLIRRLDRKNIQVFAAMELGENAQLKKYLYSIAHGIEELIPSCEICSKEMSIWKNSKSSSSMEIKKENNKKNDETKDDV